MNNSIFQKDGTAQGVAKQRLIESLATSEKRVIDDPYAYLFVAGSWLMKLMGHDLNLWISQKLAPGFHHSLIARTRFIDDYIERNNSRVEQYVILGAGYDMRPYRLNLPPNLQIYEVDQKEVQKKKLSKMSRDIANRDNVTYVSVDF